MLYKPDKGPESGRAPDPKHIAEMEQYIAEGYKSGVLVSTGGLHSSAKGARVRLSGGEVTVTDGPFTESKEVIGGYAIVQASSKEEAIEMARSFLKLAGDGETEVRQMMDPSDFAPGKASEPCAEFIRSA